MFADFHLHTVLSDGTLTPLEIGRRACQSGCRTIALTDHVGVGALERVIDELSRDCEILREEFDIIALPGVELTHVPPGKIGKLAKKAKEAGALIVVVHGETVVEPVVPRTNEAAVNCEFVDILAHPGLITLELAIMARENGVFLELSARQGHCLTNGRIVQIAKEAGVPLLVNSDGHCSSDILTFNKAEVVALGAGLSGDDAKHVLTNNPLMLLQKIGITGLSGQSCSIDNTTTH